MTYDWWGVYDEGAVKSFGFAHVVQPMVYILRYSVFWIVRGRWALSPTKTRHHCPGLTLVFAF